MKQLEKTLRYTKLLSIYKPLLTITQQEVMSDYYEYDLSLSEIAENRNISRSAVEDAIKKSIIKLDDFEEKLSILKRDDEIKEVLKEMKNRALNYKDITYISEIERRLK